MNNEYRHVCFKDLDNYLRKDLYFSDLTEKEKQLIRENLGLTDDPEGVIIKGSYMEIKQLADTRSLRMDTVYMMTDFQSIYKVGDQVLGLTVCPSKVCTLILRPSTTGTFDPRVILICYEDLISLKWTVEYDITQEDLGEVGTKGKITYLKDQNNNSAFYDFKNVRFKRTQQELDLGPKTLSEGYYYTFSDGTRDNSSSTSVKNNHLAEGCTNIVFLDSAQNVTFEGDCHNLTFFQAAANDKFYYGTRNCYFQNPIVQVRGAVHDKTLSELISMQCPKEFNVLNDKQVCVYLDPATETYQIAEL